MIGSSARMKCGRRLCLARSRFTRPEAHPRGGSSAARFRLDAASEGSRALVSRIARPGISLSPHVGMPAPACRRDCAGSVSSAAQRFSGWIKDRRCASVAVSRRTESLDRPRAGAPAPPGRQPGLRQPVDSGLGRFPTQSGAAGDAARTTPPRRAGRVTPSETAARMLPPKSPRAPLSGNRAGPRHFDDDRRGFRSPSCEANRTTV